MIRRYFLKSLAIAGSAMFAPSQAFPAGLTRLEALRCDAFLLPLDESQRAALVRGIRWYGEQITSRFAYAPGSGHSDLEVLVKFMRGNPWDGAQMDCFVLADGRAA